MAGYEVGSAFLTIMPSGRGFANNLSNEVDGPFTAAGRRGGGLMGDGVAAGGKASFVGAGAVAGGAFVAAFVAAGAFAVVKSAVTYLAEAVGAGSDLAETVNKSNVIFGDNARAIEGWASTAAKSVGLSKAAALDAASGFGNMFTQLGFASATAAAMSTDVVQLSADLGSFNNLPTAEVSDKISAALRGEYDSLQALVPNINAARVEQEALAMTGRTSADALTAAEKAAAVLAIVHRDGAAAAGDFARTSDGMAISQRIVSAEMENTKAEIGTALLPVITELFRVFADEGVPILKDLAAWFTENKDEIGRLVVATVDGGLVMADAFLALMGNMLTMSGFWLGVGQGMVNAWFTVVGAVIDGAVQMFGWVPGVGDKLRAVQAGFAGVRDDADAKFHQVRTAVDKAAAGIDSARGVVDDLRSAIHSIDGMTVTAYVKVQEAQAAYDGLGRPLSHRASGGPVRAGMPYIVGEDSAELFVPDRSGTIYNQRQIAQMGGSGGVAFPASVALLDQDGSLLGHMQVIAGQAVATVQRSARDVAARDGLRTIAVGG